MFSDLIPHFWLREAAALPLYSTKELSLSDAALSDLIRP